MRQIDGSICAPRGFKAAAVFCDIKRLGTGKGSEKQKKGDLALIVSDRPAAIAGLFTTNRVAAAPVKLSAKRAAQDFAQAIMVNSGNANACTGATGMRDAREMAQLTARALDLRERDVVVCSTGRIGVAMPMENVRCGIRGAAEKLGANAHAVAEAIMTSDTRPKEIAVEIEIDRTCVRIGGICKGAGMIHPKLKSLHATMLAFISTDAAIAPAVLKRALAIAVEQSFNRISVDGDMSTNDSVIALANGAAGNRQLVRPRAQFQEALNFVTLELAKMIVKDGEGVSRFITLHVRGARTAADAERVARSIANSVLVKTSWCGGDPNWGRILCAIGYSGVKIDEQKVAIGYSAANRRAQARTAPAVIAFRRGRPTDVGFAEFTALTSQPEFDVHIDLHAGKSDTTFYTCDLTEDYVAFNKGDVNDPSALGG
ncbi:MAG: bifunctional glutamate N-acetyltransferase/amino-acid acetyltransferase ArgJ [Chthoniobacterales bacterium]